MKTFKKRRYSAFGQFREDVGYVWRQRRYFQAPMGVKGIAGGLRERLMLAVTRVNDCRYCTFAHTRAALKEGLSKDEVAELMNRQLDHIPEDERTAVVFAQHWADSEGRPDPESVATLQKTYGEEKASSIEFCIRLIKMCNYCGNTWDYFLFRVSFGAIAGA